MLDKDKLYNEIDREEDMTDQEKREAYFGEIENDRAEREWEDNN